MSPEFIARWIEPNPHKPGPADAWLASYGVPVWTIIRQLQLDDGDLAGVAEAYDVPAEAIEAALAYYRLHHRLIDARIEVNQSVFAGA